MSDEFEREERAFADAFRAAGEAESFRPLDPAELKAAAPRRLLAGPWGKGLAAAAAVVVVALGAGVVVPQLVGGGASSSGTVEAAPEPASGMAPMDASSKAADSSGASELETARVGQWKTLPDAAVSARSNAAGAWVEGRFYVLGGQLDPPCPANADCMGPSRLLRDGASYDPGTGAWRKIADAPVPVSGAPVVVDGVVYFRAWADGEPSVYAYDTSADRWSELPSPAADGSLVAAGDRLVNIAHSTEQAAAVDEAYDPATRDWSRLPEDPLGSSYGRGAVWADGTLLLLAHELVDKPGSEEPPVVRLAGFDFATGAWRRLPDSQVIGGGAVVASGLVVFPDTGSADGGEVNNWGRSYPMGGIYNPVTGTWRELPALGDAGEGLRHVWPDSSVVGNRVLASGHLLDPLERTWTTLTPPPGGNRDGQTVIAAPDGVLVFGGWNGTGHTSRLVFLPLP